MEQPFGVDDTANDVSDDISEEFPPPPTQEPGIMKAAVIQHFGGPNVFIVKNISIPSFGPYQVSTKIRIAPINYVAAQIGFLSTCDSTWPSYNEKNDGKLKKNFNSRFDVVICVEFHRFHNYTG